ncbi:MAG TPA: glucokinase [Burkholderiaceae bacterium]|jgi:glucokinase|nr:glucokinase [Burkholderiaceae bacterium]
MNGVNLKNVKAAAYADGPRLLADIGGTNARFALEIKPQQIEAVAVLPCKNYPSLRDAMAAFLSSQPVKELCATPIRHAALAIANPVDGDLVRMTNHHWEFSIEALRAGIGLETLVVVNDFTALAMALPYLSADQKVQIGSGIAQAGQTIGLIGAGTGLGVSGIIPVGEHWVPMRSEGGHVSFSPADEVELEILRFCWREFSHVSAERLMSGMGLELIYRALREITGVESVAVLDAAEISRRALQDSCVICVRTIECFCAMLGGVAGNVAVTLGALGGMYIGGGIVPRLGSLFANSAFRARFEAKGRFSHYLSQIPTYLITAEYPAFLGVSAILSEKLSKFPT